VLVLGSEVNDADQLLRRLGWQSFWAATCKTGGRTAELVTVSQIFVSQVGPISLPISLTQNKMVSFRCNESMTGPVSICIFTKKKCQVPFKDGILVLFTNFTSEVWSALAETAGGLIVPKSQSDTGIHWESCGIYNL
jgi:hypothetical protein